jgi:hypothetical protein
MRPAIFLVLTGAFLVGGAISLPGSGEHARAQETTTVAVGDFFFCDSSFTGGVCETTVNVGDTVEWSWSGSFPHTTTECGGDLDLCAEPHLWDSGTKTSGSFSFTFESPGTFVYRCQIHPNQMRGQITVLAAEQETPSPTPAPTAAPTPEQATPRQVPTAGGPPSPGSASAYGMLIIAAGAGLLLFGAVAALRALRRAG